MQNQRKLLHGTQIKILVMVNPKDLFEKEQTQILNAEEVVASIALENFIDAAIKKSFLSGRASVPDFSYMQEFNKINSVRKKIVTDKVLNKYEKFWTYKFEYGKDDGPNRPGMNYWVFTAKK